MAHSYSHRRRKELEARTARFGTREENMGNFLPSVVAGQPTRTSSEVEQATTQERKFQRFHEQVVPIPYSDGLHYVRLSDCRRDWHIHCKKFSKPNTRQACEEFIANKRQPRQHEPATPLAPQRNPSWYLGGYTKLPEE